MIGDMEEEEDSSPERWEEMEETEEKDLWPSKSGIMRSSSHAKMLPYIPAATGMVPGPTRYAIARCSTMESSMDLFVTDDILDLILKMTNLQGRRTQNDWMDLDLVDVRGYIGLLVLAGVYRLQNQSLRSLWEEETGRIIFQAAM